MLAGVTPSVDITGGPWFTDNELDVEFVEVLKKVIKKFLMDKVCLPLLLSFLTNKSGVSQTVTNPIKTSSPSPDFANSLPTNSDRY